MQHTVAVIINKDDGHLSPSETFLRAHINGLPCNVITLIGNPGYRHLDESSGRYVPSRSIIPLGMRWAARQIGISTSAAQDRRAVSRFLRSRRVSAVLAEYGPTAVSVMDACRDAGIPLIAHFHGWDAYREYELTEYANRYPRLFQQASAIVAVSQHMRNQLLAMGANPENTFHNACGSEIPTELRSNPGEAEQQFLMVGRMTEKKAPLLSILAFSRVAALFPDATLVVIGDGPLKNACEQLCKGLDLSERIAFLGAQPHSKVVDCLTRARCFVQHSVCAPSGDREGTPVAVLEAMGMGLPVVTTRHGGIMDIVENGSTGSLVDEYDVDGMAQAMIKYADDALLAQRIGENARDAVLAHWTCEKSIKRLWDIIKQAIAVPLTGK